MVEYPRRMRHDVPSWVNPGEIYHIRMRTAPKNVVALTDPTIGASLLESAAFYHDTLRWRLRCLLLMPDHLHALIGFFPDQRMSTVVGAWKVFNTRRSGIFWQTGYFDHRIRNTESLDVKLAYILRNPVVKGLCLNESDWPWTIEIRE
ncbi:MAG TPA: transposase [Candidatus Didemnitutus sp.]|nr:transposase [Candidatus Didemnitutus sp.]